MVFVVSRYAMRLEKIIRKLLMLSMTRLILTGKPNNFVYIWILSRIGKRGDGLNYGPEKIQILSVIENPENKKIKVTVSDI